MKKLILTTLCLFFVAGCVTSSKKAPVHTLTADAARTTHTIVKGETLYSVAFRYGWDYRDLAAMNHIAPPYHVHSGQVIRLVPGRKSPQPAVRWTKQSSPKQKVSQPSIAVKEIKEPIAVQNALDNRKRQWIWPAKGKLLMHFHENHTLKGIDIEGKRGAPVRAAADGEVVYAGSGLRGFGELIIIKHDNDYLSAYAHNEKIRVQEGAKVKVGEQIAEMGDSGADRVKLHFEIRKRGKPVDPLRYLPTM